MNDSIEENEKKSVEQPPPHWVIKIFAKLNVLVYKVSRGRLMNNLDGMPIVLVTMKGARSGKKITLPVMYVPYDKGFVLVASKGGAPKHPSWYYNLIKNPSIQVTYKNRKLDLTARLVDEDERSSLWPICVEYYPPYREYQQRTERLIPVFLCE